MKHLVIVIILCVIMVVPARKSFYRVMISAEAVSETSSTLRAVGLKNAEVFLVNGADTLRNYTIGNDGCLYFNDLEVGSIWELVVRHKDYPEHKKTVSVWKNPIYDGVIMKNGTPIIYNPGEWK